MLGTFVSVVVNAETTSTHSAGVRGPETHVLPNRTFLYPALSSTAAPSPAGLANNITLSSVDPGRVALRCPVALAEFLLLLDVEALPALDADGLRAGEAQEVLP